MEHSKWVLQWLAEHPKPPVLGTSLSLAIAATREHQEAEFDAIWGPIFDSIAESERIDNIVRYGK